MNNLGQKVGFISQKDPLPAGINIGASMAFGSLTKLASLSRGIYDQTTAGSLGLETNLGPVSLRAGYRSDSGAGNRGSGVGSQGGVAGALSGFSTGMGLHIKMMRLDYALGQEAQDLEISHRASLTFQFGKGVR